jgi:hypothetical protein
MGLTKFQLFFKFLFILGKKKKNIGIIISSWMNENFITNQKITHSNNQVGTQAIRLQMQSHNKILSKQSTQKS